MELTVSQEGHEGQLLVRYGEINSRALAGYLERQLGLTQVQARRYDVLQTAVEAWGSKPTATVQTSGSLRVGGIILNTVSGAEPIVATLHERGDSVVVFDSETPDLPKLRFSALG